MGSGLLRLVGALSIVSLALVGCIYAPDVPEEPQDPTMLDPASMTDEELAAETMSAYRGMLLELKHLRMEDDPNYDALRSSSTPEYADRLEATMQAAIPEGHVLRLTPEVVWVELSATTLPDSAVRAHICVDNTAVVEFDEDGKEVTNRNVPRASVGTVTFVLSAQADRLLVDSEQPLGEPLDRECAPFSEGP